MKNQIIFLLCLYPLNPLTKTDLLNSQTKDIEKSITEYKVIHNENVTQIEYYKSLLIGMLAQESGTGRYVHGDGGAAQGILQIRKSFVDNINKVCNTNYTYEDRLNPTKSIEMFLLFQQHYNPKMSYEIGAKIWNGGQNCNLNSDACNKYWASVKSHIDNQTNILLANNIIENAKLALKV
jgi:hypothetical protein